MKLAFTNVSFRHNSPVIQKWLRFRRVFIKVRLATSHNYFLMGLK